MASRFTKDLRAPHGEDLGSIAWLALIGAGALVGSGFGAVVALLGLIALRREGSGAVLRAAFLALCLAGLATVALTWPTALYDVRFATSRPAAAALGEAAAVLALVGVAAEIRRRWARATPRSSLGEAAFAGDGYSDVDGEHRSAARRLGASLSGGLTPIVLLFTALALLAVLSNGFGHYVVDNHRELAWSPGQLLSRQRYLWNADQGFGRPNEESWFVVGVFFALLRSIGASAALAGRLFHATLLVAGGVGMVAFMRLFRRPIGVAHVSAGLVYMFNPYTAAALVPSILFVPYALAPWFLFVFFQGVRGRRPWRWAAVFALLALVASTADIPGLTYGLLPLVPAALYITYVERSAGWGHIFGWLARAFVLTAGVFAAPLVRAVIGGAALAQRVGLSELPAALNVASSWSESWRGLGFWLLYWRDSGALIHPELAAYFSSPITIFATFAAPCVALASLWWSRARLRLFFALTTLLAMVFMVGSYPPGHPSPYGNALLHGYANSLFLWGWRNSYKAGPGWAIGVAGLVGLAVFEAWRRWRYKVELRRTVAVVAVLVLGLASLPFWTNHLYGAQDRLASSLPSYWRQANAWLDRDARDGRVLVLPGMTIPVYRWGTVGGDAVQTKASTLMARSFPFETAQAADLLHALDDSIAKGTLAGSLAPIASRLGVRYVVFQNDIDWAKTGVPRPATLHDVRGDSALTRVATFGAPGKNVVDPHDGTLSGLYEATLPPVEIYRIDQRPQPLVRPAPPLLVSGNGDAWLSLAQRGRLDTGRPVVYTASVGASALATALRAGSDVVVSDTNRRRVTEATAYNLQTSYTLSPSATLDRPPNPLFAQSDAESVALYGDATSISASGYGASLIGSQPWLRPANAFDGDTRTSWETGGFGTGVGAWIRVDFATPKQLSQVALTDSNPSGLDRYVSRASIVFSDGTQVPARLSGGHADVRFSPRRTKSVEVRIDAIGGRGFGLVGFSEIAIPGVSVGERIRLPEDIVSAAQHDSALRPLLDRAPLEFQFDRARAASGQDEELVLHRQFDSLGQRTYDVGGTIQAADSASDEFLARLVGGPTPTFGSSRVGGLAAIGAAAVDGDLATSWGGRPEPGQRLTTNFAAAPVSSVSVSINADADHSAVKEIRITVGNENALATVPPPETCVAGQPCIVGVSATFSGAAASQATVEVTRVEPRPTALGPAPVGIAEVAVNGRSGAAQDQTRPIVGCFSDLLRVDGRAVPLSLEGNVGDLENGRPLSTHACGQAVTLGPGTHQLDTSDQVLVNDLALSSNPRTAAVEVPPLRAQITSKTSTVVGVDAGSGGIVLTGQSYDVGWRATVASHDLGHPIAADTQSAWILPAGGARTVEMRYAPEHVYRLAVVVSFAFLGICVLLIARRRKRPVPPTTVTRRRSVRVEARSST